MAEVDREALLAAFEQRLREERWPEAAEADDATERLALELGLAPAEVAEARSRVEAERGRETSALASTQERALFEQARWRPWARGFRRFLVLTPLGVALEVWLWQAPVVTGVVGGLTGVRLVLRYAALRWPDPEDVEREFAWWRRKRQARALVDRGVDWVLRRLGG